QEDVVGLRHLEPLSASRHKRTDKAENVGCLQRPPFIVPHEKRRRPGQCPPARAATGRSAACAPRPRSWAFEYRERSRCGIETTSSRRCSSGEEGTATPIESCLVGPGYCPSGPALSLGVSFRSRRVNQLGRHNALRPVGCACFATTPRAPACRLSLCRPPSRALTGAPSRVLHHRALARYAPGAPPQSAGFDY